MQSHIDIFAYMCSVFAYMFLGPSSQLVVGDVFAATTHTDLFTRCRQKGIPVEAIHNASIMNAVGCCG